MYNLHYCTVGITDELDDMSKFSNSSNYMNYHINTYVAISNSYLAIGNRTKFVSCNFC